MPAIDAFGIRWTDSQRQALDIGSNVAVTAGAGSGKTQVLSARYLLAAEQLLSRGDYRGPESILVLTFTEKAAAEMKERIGAAISDYVHSDDFEALTYEHQERWLRFYRDLPVGEISTIHSFCARVLRQFPVESGVDPEFAIIEEYDQRQLLEDSIRGVMNDLARDMDPNLKLLLKVWSAPYLVNVLATVVLNGDRLAEWIDRYRTYPEEKLVEDQRNAVAAVVTEGFRRLATAGTSSLVDEIACCQPLRDPTGDKLEERRCSVVGLWRRCLASLQQGYIDLSEACSLVELLCRGKGEPRSFGNTGSKSVWGEVGREYLTSRLNSLAAAVSAQVRGLQFDLGPTDLMSIPMLKALAEVGHGAVQRFQMAKLHARMLDFADLEIKTRDLLRSHPEIRRDLAQRYRYVMVDEFQDTNAMQWEIIRHLCTTGDDQQYAPDKLFLVGDEKQAIYSFRGGDVATFARARRELALSAERSGTSSYRSVVFEENFRSCQRLVDSFNFLFEKLLGSGEVEDYEALFQSMVKANPKLTQDGRAEIHLVSAAEGVDRRAAEAEVVAQLAAEMMTDSAVREVADGKMPLVAILMRRMSVVKVYEGALRRHGLIFSTVKGRGFYQQQEVLDLFNLLAFLADERRDVELLGVLRSPVFALSDDEIVGILANTHGTVWERLCRNQSQAAVRCVDTLKRWLLLKDRCSVATLIRRILTDSDLYIPLAYGQRGRQRLANIEKVIALARSSDADGRSLAAFVSFLENQMDSAESEGEAEIAIESPIVLMTVHQAKGLQFPAVIVPDLSGEFNMGSDSAVYIGEIGGKVELGISAPNPDADMELSRTALRAATQHVTGVRQLAEQKRLLYVAATRAQILLAMVGQMPGESAAGRDFGELRCWCDWLERACGLRSAVEAASEPSDARDAAGELVRSAKVGPMTVAIHEFSTQQQVDQAGQVASAGQVAHAGRVTQAGQVAQTGQVAQNAAMSSEVAAGKDQERLGLLETLSALEVAPSRAPERRRTLHTRDIITLSATAVMDFTRCPRFFYLRHRLGVPEQLLAASLGLDDAQSAVAASAEASIQASIGISMGASMGARIGDIFHRLVAMEVYDADDPRVRPVVASLLPPTDLPMLETYVSNISAHLQAFESLGYSERLRKLPASARRCEVGLDVVVDSNDRYEVRFTGFIDMMVTSGLMHWRILDFKTNALNQQPTDQFTRAHLYDLQMRLYMAIAGLALNRAGRADSVDMAEIVYTSVAQMHEVEPASDTIDQLLAIAERVYANDFPRRPGSACSDCVYQSLCEF